MIGLNMLFHSWKSLKLLNVAYPWNLDCIWAVGNTSGLFATVGSLIWFFPTAWTAWTFGRRGPNRDASGIERLPTREVPCRADGAPHQARRLFKRQFSQEKVG